MASPQKKGAAENGSVCSAMWADMAPDVLANIFSRLPLEQLLSVIPCVCKPWMLASFDPCCWQVLDLSELRHKATGGLVEVFVRRTEGHLREFVYPYMGNPNWLNVIQNSASVLQKLHIPNSCANNTWAINVAPLMTRITDLDLSNLVGRQLSHEALEAFGKHCKHITHLRRNEDHSRVRWVNTFNEICESDSPAFAIALNYPSLKHLELRNSLISTQGVRAILDGCPMLEYLDLTACVMDMDEPLLRECQTRLRMFLEPRSTDYKSSNDDDDDDNIGFRYRDGCGVCDIFGLHDYLEMRHIYSNDSDGSDGPDDRDMHRNREYNYDFRNIEAEY